MWESVLESFVFGDLLGLNIILWGGSILFLNVIVLFGWIVIFLGLYCSLLVFIVIL